MPGACAGDRVAVTSLWTFGHGTADRQALTDLLTASGVAAVVDVRRFPGSRRDANLHRDAMARWLPATGVDYRWEPRLGGRRRVPAGQNPEVDGWWRVTSFRAYATHMRTAEFADALGELLAQSASADGPVAIMCSETVWWRCHRRMISDAAVLLRHVDVRHLGHDGRLAAHPPADGARVTDDGLRYDAASSVAAPTTEALHR
ncbi:DUF488 domain-containing protein [Nocardioides sp. SYSU DS0663]|uniref:DUF488 domain-containing protein n=1 Tax=Nocardioides sp. SYSU DS0663 TaxID=3416445 RepID=UPI003F4BD915